MSDQVEIVVKKKGRPPKKEVAAPVVKKEEAPKGYIKAKAGKYKATKKCYFGLRLYSKGAIYEAESGELIPYHFEKVKRVIEVDD